MPVDYTSENTDDSTFDSTPSSSDNEEVESEDDDDSEGEMDDSLFIEFRRSDQHSSKQNHSFDDLSDMSLDDSSAIGAQQLEANLMDASPNRLRRK